MINTTTEVDMYVQTSKNTFLVGGAVRDILMGVTPKDRDYVVIGETVETMKTMGFEQVGKDFPVFLHPETKEEYALARRERKTGQGYNGFSVDTLHVSLEEDLSRRDLTINSMAMDDAGNLIDPFNGKRDLAYKILRHTSDAFSEDPLRVVRVLRFAARYGFTIADETKLLIRSMVSTGKLNELPIERFWVEMEKAFSDSNPAWFIELVYEFGLNQWVKFFATMFDHVGIDTAFGVAYTIAQQHPKSENALDFFVGVMSYHNPRINSFPSALAGKIAAPFKALRLEWDSEYPAESLHNVFNKAGAFREGGVEGYFCQLVRGYNMPNRGIHDFDKLVAAVAEAKGVSAAQFPELSGKELGDAIKQRRIEKFSIFAN